MSYRLIDHPPHPFTTLSGKTSGPCVAVGRVPYAKQGAPIYMHVETELRKAVKDAGWPNPETHAAAVAELDAVRAELAATAARLETVLAENETLRAAFAIVKPDADAEPAAKPRKHA